MTASIQTAPEDALATLVPVEAQQQAARHAQDGFSHVFRDTLEGAATDRGKRVLEIAQALLAWSREGAAAATPARQALILAGLDHWGLAYSQVFGGAALAGLTALVGAVRDGLAETQDATVAAEAACQAAFSRLHEEEAYGFSFKAALRREIHLALWHAMIADEERESALGLASFLGSLMLALRKSMPASGWRILADTLAHIQIRCLAHGLAAEGLAQESTQALLQALSREMPAEEWRRICAHAAQALLAWQQASRQQH